MIKYIDEDLKSKVQAVPKIVDYLREIEKDGIDHFLIYQMDGIKWEKFYKVHAINQVGELVVLTFHKNLLPRKHAISWSEAQEYLRIYKEHIKDAMAMDA